MLHLRRQYRSLPLYRSHMAKICLAPSLHVWSFCTKTQVAQPIFHDSERCREKGMRWIGIWLDGVLAIRTPVDSKGAGRVTPPARAHKHETRSPSYRYEERRSSLCRASAASWRRGVVPQITSCDGPTQAGKVPPGSSSSCENEQVAPQLYACHLNSIRLGPNYQVASHQ